MPLVYGVINCYATSSQLLKPEVITKTFHTVACFTHIFNQKRISLTIPHNMCYVLQNYMLQYHALTNRYKLYYVIIISILYV